MTRRAYLYEVRKQLKPHPVCAEVGVYRGDFAQLMLEVLEPEFIQLFDPFEVGKEVYPDGMPTAYSTSDDLQFVRNRFKDKRAFVFPIRSDEVELCESYYDFVYIDASHLYEDVKKDLQRFEGFLKSDGILAGHDYGSDVFTGVKKAVDEFCIENNYEMIILNKDGGDFALKKRD